MNKKYISNNTADDPTNSKIIESPESDTEDGVIQTKENRKTFSRRKLVTGAVAVGAISLIGKLSDVIGQKQSSSPILDPANDTSLSLGTYGTEVSKRSKHEKYLAFLDRADLGHQVLLMKTSWAQ